MDLDDIPVHSSAPAVSSNLAHVHDTNAQPRTATATSAYALPFQTGAAAAAAAAAASSSRSNAAAADQQQLEFDTLPNAESGYGPAHDQAFAQLIHRAIRMGSDSAAGQPPPPSKPKPARASRPTAAPASADSTATTASMTHQPQVPRDPAQVHLERIRKRFEAEQHAREGADPTATPSPPETATRSQSPQPTTGTEATATSAGSTSERQEQEKEQPVALKAGPDHSAQTAVQGTASATDADISNSNSSAAPAPAASTSTSTSTSTHKPGRGPGSRARWTPAEDRKLIQFVHYADPPLTWDEIGAKMGRAATGCSMRWYKFLRDKSGGPNQRASPAEAGGKDAQSQLADGASAVEAAKIDNNGQDKGKGKEGASKTPTASGPAGSPDDVLDPSLYLQVAQQHAPSDEMVIGGSAGQQQQPGDEARSASERQESQEQSSGGQDKVPAKKPTKAKAPRKASAIATGRLVDIPYISPDQLPPPLPPAPDLPGHPFPRDPATRVHSNAGQHYLLKSALVEKPPIPFKKNTVLRGRRTKPIEDLQEEMARELEKQKADREAKRQEFIAQAIKEMNESGTANQPEMNDETYDAYMRGEGPPPRGTAFMQIVPTGKGRLTGPGARGGTSKGGTTVHTCPAENCNAAFKRSEHLRRHYKAVHRGEK
ncbi:hypothetical protein JCM3774_004368, partial [Rhodotorula dairenensis]